MRRHKILVIVIIATMIGVQQSHADASVTVDHVEGLYGGDTVWAHTPIEFTIRFTNNIGDNVTGFTNAWRIWTHRNGTFADSHDTVTIASLGTLEPGYDGGVFWGWFSGDGTGMDTVKLGGFAIFGTGMPDGFDEQVAKIATVLDTPGDTLCIDSTYYPPRRSLVVVNIAWFDSPRLGWSPLLSCDRRLLYRKFRQCRSARGSGYF